MAKFKVGEKARYVGCRRMHPSISTRVGSECTVIDPLAVRPEYALLFATYDIPRYGVKFNDGEECWVMESSLEKLVPGHQPNDLKSAEPLFIQTTLPRWLGQEEVKREEA